LLLQKRLVKLGAFEGLRFAKAMIPFARGGCLARGLSSVGDPVRTGTAWVVSLLFLLATGFCSVEAAGEEGAGLVAIEGQLLHADSLPLENLPNEADSSGHETEGSCCSTLVAVMQSSSGPHSAPKEQHSDELAATPYTPLARPASYLALLEGYLRPPNPTLISSLTTCILSANPANAPPFP
jgi:hypothetical protein